MRKQFIYQIAIALCMLAATLASCQDDAMEEIPENGMKEGMAAFHLQTEESPHILTRADGESTCDKDEPILNVYLMLFDTDGKKISTAYQQLVDNNRVVNLYLPQGAQTVYAFCNLTDTAILENVATEEDLKKVDVTIGKPQEAYTGSFVLSGKNGDLKQAVGTFQSEYTIPLTRLAARLVFEIKIEVPENETFKVSSAYMHYIPKGSKLLEAKWTDSLQVAEGDYTYASGVLDRLDKYFATNGKHDSLWIDLKKKEDGFTAMFHQFENRQGRLKEELGADGTPIDRENSYWKKIASLDMEQYKLYQQIYKRELAVQENFDYAGYLTIHGFYTERSGKTEKVTYYLYVGNDNYKDFNVCRNHTYIYDVRIKAKDKLDTRVLTAGTGKIDVEGNFGGDRVLDAHCNVVEALLFSESGWTVRVADPDRTPWLEVSKAPTYIPRMVGETDEQKASFRISGSAGLDYFYIHTDEYVPEIKKPADNNSIIKPGLDGFQNIREGKLICESRNGGYKEITIRQYAAQMVILHAKYLLGTDGLVMKEVRDTFYVERSLEERNLKWGFDQYWSSTLDNMIGWGNWDGLWNTRKLYEVALQGDKYTDPAYPAEKGGIPADIALGYALNKNRDRNGNGKIDYEEIMWYLPAVNELNALCTSIHDKSETDWVDTEDRGFVWLDEENTVYHSSTPSVADPAGITAGRNYFVDFLAEKQGICLRTRFCNVICMRRKGAWRGADTGTSEGNIEIDDNWSGDEEVVMPK